MAAPQKKCVSRSGRWGSSNLSLQDSQTMCMEGVLVPSSVPGPMPPNGHPGYEYSTIPPQQHGGDMIHHPSHPVSPSIYPQHHYHHPPPPPPQGGCFPLLHMVPCQMVPSPTGQPQQSDHFAFAFPVIYWPYIDFPVGDTGSQIDQQNPDPDREQADPRGFGPLTHSYPHLMPYVHMAYMPHHVPEEHACSSVSGSQFEAVCQKLTMQNNIDEKRVVGQSSGIIEISGERTSNNFAKPSNPYQSASERVKPPSVVNGPQAKRKTGEEGWQRIQQSDQVPLGPQQRHSISNQPAQQSKSLLRDNHITQNQQRANNLTKNSRSVSRDAISECHHQSIVQILEKKSCPS